MANYLTNCPNCGAPLRSFGKCDYCGTTINQPLQFVTIRPGLRKLVGQARVPLFIGEDRPEVVADFAKHSIRSQMADALTDSIKFVVRRDYDLERLEEIVMVRGELWVADPDVMY